MNLPTKTLRAVAFDMDGLMFNTEELYEKVGDLLLRRRGHRITRPLLDKMMGRPGPIALQVMIDMHELDATVEQLQQETSELFPAILDTELAPMDGLMELLEALEKWEIPKGVCTSSRRAFAEKALSQFDLQRRFDFVLTSDDVRHGKPAPDIYAAAAGRWKVDPDEMMVLEDSQVGCEAAVAAGAFAIAVPGPHNAHHQYPGAMHIAETLADPYIYSSLQQGRPD